MFEAPFPCALRGEHIDFVIFYHSKVLKQDSWSTFRIYQPPIGFKFKALW